MSQFLAPIHTWLFNKILILEDVEKEIAKGLETQNLQEKQEAILEKYGQFIPDQPLETMIDQSNIHGWLQERITVAERRQAALVNILLESSENALEGIQNIYENKGREHARRINAKATEPAEMFNLLGDVLLEGMPCDRVNRLIEQEEDKVIWQTAVCVHKNNWEQESVPVEHYYHFREAFTRGFVEETNSAMRYTYTLGEEQLHELTI